MLMIKSSDSTLFEARFVCKPVDLFHLKEMLHQGGIRAEPFVIDEWVVLNGVEWGAFADYLVKDRSYLKGKGGYYEDLTRLIARKCIAVLKGEFYRGQLLEVDTSYFLIVDPQGHSNVRYVALSIEVEDQEIGFIAQEQIKKLKRPAETGRN